MRAKRKLDLLSGDDDDLHQHSRVNFSIPKLGKNLAPEATCTLKRSPKASEIGSDVVPPIVAVVNCNNFPI